MRKVFIILCLAILFNSIFAADYVPADKILLNCGAKSPESTDIDGRKWTPDVGSKFAPVSANSTADEAATQDPSVPEIPYMTARIFRSEFTYSFPVASGRKFVRLYFYPASYAGLDASEAIFSVTSGNYTLLKNFSAAQTTAALNFAFIVKEYSINVDSGTLNITFTPDPNTSTSYAFVNGIEIVSMPDIYSTPDEGIKIVGQKAQFYIDNATALENVYRLNVGGNYISPANDTGMFRSWSDDSRFIAGAAHGVTVAAVPDLEVVYPSGMPKYVAPADVYATARTMGPSPVMNRRYNLTWTFGVDSGFSYLVRLHFCEVSSYIRLINERVFEIFVNNETAYDGADVVGWTQRGGVALYKDYAVMVPGGGRPRRQDLWLALHPNLRMRPRYYDAILNGLEIFKISDSEGNLAGSNPAPMPKQYDVDPPSGTASPKFSMFFLN